MTNHLAPGPSGEAFSLRQAAQAPSGMRIEA